MSRTTPALTDANEVAHPGVRLPLASLLALSLAGFLGILNETVPAGLLPETARGLGVSESAAGQVITVYALATALTAIPLNALLKDIGRRKLMVAALATFAAANLVITLVDSFAVMLAARVIAGVGAGLIWSNLGGTAARLVSPDQQSKAVAIAMAGTPAALSLGLPAGTLLGDAAGWQMTYGAAAAASIAVIVWMLFVMPDVSGEPDGGHVAIGDVIRAPGVRLVMLVLAGFFLAHNLLYTYVGPLADASGVRHQLTVLLLVFGLAALASVWLAGAFADPHHRPLIVTSTVGLAVSSLVLSLPTTTGPLVLFVGGALWGLAFGGSATLFVTAGLRAAGSDVIQSVIVTVVNLSIGAAGLIGGILLAGAGPQSVALTAFGLALPTAAATVAGRRHAFPSWAAQR